MAPKICGATNPPSTIDDTEELTTESERNHTAVSRLSQTSPELGPLTNVGQGIMLIKHMDPEVWQRKCGPRLRAPQ
ncbi:hypothetical protein FQN60_012505 [Etheostoma spectabile]|uniref:Uncharacterized protein n=1 Tax=Etheostoma spectabile TaxID=54343 RepID=A0A5J5DQ22_9PERO|nr:hypothetical protein FQN60_012505 [Etheostoma spectabile]